MTRLSNSTLSSEETASKVSVPKYDRSQVRPGILHIGVGNFHRAHMATYMDDLMNSDFENHKDWGIVGAGIMSFDAEKRKLLESQDWLQTLVQRDADSVKARVIGSMTDFLPVDYQLRQHIPLKRALEDPSIKIVSLTVTEGGYFLNDGAFDPDHPQIKYDIQHPDEPQSIFGMMVNALGKRRQAGTPPFVVMSCDNIPGNGHIAESVVVGMASKIDTDLAVWIKKEVAFPNSMVDRITPGTTPAQVQHIRETYNYEDASPIFCEPFRQWIMEDRFPNGRPDFERLEGFKFVEDVAPYELMKIRILNGGHASLCYPAALLDVPHVHNAMEHPTIGAFLDKLERTEIIPTVPPVPDTCLQGYWKLIGKRFSNPTIADTIGRICFDGGNRQPKFIVPVASDALKAGKSVDGLAMVSAMWCHYCLGATESGVTIAPNDPQWDRLQGLAEQATSDPTAWLSMADVYGEVGRNPVFIEAFTRALKMIQSEGAEAAMRHYIES